MRAIFVYGMIATVCMAGGGTSALAKPSTTTPAATEANQDNRLSAQCIDVKGMVRWAALGTKSTDRDAWKPVKKGETYRDGVQIQTGIRSAVVFRFGDDTVVMVDRMTLAAIGHFRKIGKTKQIRLGLDYGQIRAGVAEGELRSDLEIDAASVTLSKRGTWDFQLRVERGTGRFEARLADRGLVEILQKSTGRRQNIRPQQWVNQAMLNWVETAKFDQKIVVTDTFSQTADELLAYIRNSTGRTGLQPAGRPPSTTGTTSQTQTPAQRAASDSSSILSRANLISMITADQTGPVRTDDGDFGTGAAFGSSSAQKRIGQRAVQALSRSSLFKSMFPRR